MANAAIVTGCSNPLTYAGTTLIALIVAISVIAVANALRRPGRREINSGTIVIVANANALIHSVLARCPRPACVTNAAAPLTSSAQAMPHALAISTRVVPPTLATSPLAVPHALTSSPRAVLSARAISRRTRGVGSALAAAMIRGIAVFNTVLISLGR